VCAYGARVSLLEAIAETEPEAPRRVWKRVVAVGLVAVLVVTAVVVVVYVHRYQPLGDPGFAQDSAQMRSGVQIVTDNLGDNTYVLTGATGSVGTVDYTIGNNGRFDITVLGPADGGPPYRMQLRWAPATVSVGPNASRGPTLAEARPLPATIKAHEEVQLFVSVTKPDFCAPNGTQTIESVPIRWKAFGVHHVTSLHLDPRSLYYPIAVCAPAAALR
jgi:hypothetical protein